MIFKNYQLFIDEMQPSITDFNLLKSAGLRHDIYKNEAFEIHMDLSENRFFQLFADYDNHIVYKQEVWDIDSEIVSINPRLKTQVELRKQYLACYDLYTYKLYVSDPDKMAFLKNYINKNLQKKVVVKSFISSIDDLSKNVQFLKEIRFYQTRNLINTAPDSIFQKQLNIFGLDTPESLQLKINFGRVSLKGFLHALKQLGTKKLNGEFKEIVVIGEDDKGIEKSFDFLSLISSLVIEAEKDENGLYDTEKIMRLLIDKVREGNV